MRWRVERRSPAPEPEPELELPAVLGFELVLMLVVREEFELGAVVVSGREPDLRGKGKRDLLAEVVAEEKSEGRREVIGELLREREVLAGAMESRRTTRVGNVST